MTAATALARADMTRLMRRGRREAGVEKVSRSDPPRLSPRLQLIRAVLVLFLAMTGTLLLQLVMVSALQQSAAQGRAFDALRSDLATGTAPIGPTDAGGRVLALGTPIAFIDIPSIGVSEVIGEGTTASVLFDGPGHRRDTPVPGQVGSSVIFGRRAAFGGPFSDISELKPGATIRVTTGQGIFEFKVLGVRREGMPAPAAPAAGTARLLLVTAAGRAFLPEGVVRVDADLVGQAAVGPPRLITAAALPANERVMAGDAGTLWVLAFWLQALILLSVAVVWSWHRWGRAQTWVVLFPALLFVGLAASGEVARLLPNLL